MHTIRLRNWREAPSVAMPAMERMELAAWSGGFSSGQCPIVSSSRQGVLAASWTRSSLNGPAR
jgi:hypothetical protein